MILVTKADLRPKRVKTELFLNKKTARVDDPSDLITRVDRPESPETAGVTGHTIDETF
jgi:5,10-methylenetetrahydrofolate reductase